MPRHATRRLSEAVAAVAPEALPLWKREGDAAHLPLDFHGIRHTVRALLSSRGHRDAAVGALLGQTNPATLRRYNHAHAEEARTIAADLAGFLGPDRKAAGE